MTPTLPSSGNSDRGFQPLLSGFPRCLNALFIAGFTLVFFLVPAGRFYFEIGGYAFSSGFNVYKIFPLLFLIRLVLRNHFPPRHLPDSPVTPSFLALFCVCFLSSLTSISPYQSFTESLEILIYLLFYWMLIDLPWNPTLFRWAGTGFLAGCWYLIATCLWQLYTAEGWVWNIKLNGTYDYPNALGVFCLLCAGLLAWLSLFCKAGWEKNIVLFTTAWVLFCGMMSQSRAFYLCLAVPVVWGLIRGNKKIRLTAASVALVMILFAIPLMLPKWMGMSSELHSHNEMSRLMIWAYLFEHFLPELPLFGYGLGPVIPDRMADWLASTRYEPRLSQSWHPHNLYLYMLLATGVPGLLAFVYWMAAAIQTSRQTPPLERGVLVFTFIGFLLYQCFEVHLLLGNIPVVLVTLMAIASLRHVPAESGEKP